MIIPMLCVTLFVILVVWFLLPRVARLMIHTPTAISIVGGLSMVQVMAVFISMRCTLCGFFFQAEDGIRDLTVTGVQTCALPIWCRFGVVVIVPVPPLVRWRLGVTLWRVLPSFLTAERRDVERSEEHTSELQSQSNLVCRLLLEKKKQERCRILCNSHTYRSCYHT